MGCNSETTLVMIPAYNAEDYLSELITRCLSFVCNEHLLIVDDGSTDSTLEIIKQNKINYISFPENRGKGAALSAGFEYAINHGYRSILTLDADLQHLPEEIPYFFAKDTGKQVVLGVRHLDWRVVPFGRWVTNNLTSIIVSVFSRQRVRDSQSGYRLIPVELLAMIKMKTVGYDFESEMLFKAGALGYPVAEVPVTTVYDGSPSFINPFTETLRFVRQIWKRIWV